MLPKEEKDKVERRPEGGPPFRAGCLPLGSSRYMLGQLWVAPEELPELLEVEGEALAA